MQAQRGPGAAQRARTQVRRRQRRAVLALQQAQPVNRLQPQAAMLAQQRPAPTRRRLRGSRAAR